jgi:hypothetical protein
MPNLGHYRHRISTRALAIPGRIGDAGGGKALGAEAAGVATPAGAAGVVGLIAGDGEPIVDAQLPDAPEGVRPSSSSMTCWRTATSSASRR